MPILAGALIGALLLVSPPVAGAKASSGDTDPATQRYINALKPNLIAVANATKAEHFPCFHVVNGAKTPKCKRLHAVTTRAVKKTLDALAKVTVSKKLVSADKKLRAALSAYLAQLNLFSRHPERVQGDIDTTPLNNAILDMARLLRTYLPLIG